MKTVARMSLTPGMVIADDVLSYKNEIIVPKKTTVDDAIITKLARYSIMCVDIMEPEDFATTHFEKIILTKGFKDFNAKYNEMLPLYKSLINEIVYNKKPIQVRDFYTLYASMVGFAKSGEMLLDYLYNMVPSEDDMTYAHCFNSALIAGVFGTWLALPKEDIAKLIGCGFFYDIGKLLIPNEILWKPSKLTDQEFQMIKNHTINGFNLIAEQNIEEDIFKATLQHHERCDGTGYPSKLKDSQINMFAKYISIIDAYEAMTSARTYRKSLNPFQVIANFEKTSSFYNQIALNTILSHIASTQLGMNVRLSDEREGEVILINQLKYSKPLIKIGGDVLDLSKYPELEIVAVL